MKRKFLGLFLIVVLLEVLSSSRISWKGIYLFIHYCLISSYINYSIQHIIYTLVFVELLDDSCMSGFVFFMSFCWTLVNYIQKNFDFY